MLFKFLYPSLENSTTWNAILYVALFNPGHEKKIVYLNDLTYPPLLVHVVIERRPKESYVSKFPVLTSFGRNYKYRLPFLVTLHRFFFLVN